MLFLPPKFLYLKNSPFSQYSLLAVHKISVVFILYLAYTLLAAN